MKQLTLVLGLIIGIILFTSIDSNAQCRPRRGHRRGGFVYIPPPVIITPAPGPVVVVRPLPGPVRFHRRFRRW